MNINSKERLRLAKAFVTISEEESEKIKKAIRKSEYRNTDRFAEQVLMIHRVSLSRKLNGMRKFMLLEIYLIEDALELKIDIDDTLVSRGHKISSKAK